MLGTILQNVVNPAARDLCLWATWWPSGLPVRGNLAPHRPAWCPFRPRNCLWKDFPYPFGLC